ncbi:hypothetical protein MKQ68_13640 [Chitinophaga horti]|uniref:Phosphoribosylpyrophosphate synthetase n=1 Tax=Chitinophaga horti TaxID=2920382 RepID=A0ABY6IYB4_9BACT|nr:hypothetical protein [Chitinophaga horti]UYQ91136.1 hypothetical protein MKQ68_13640 [Chitinophaga horti]
MEPLHTMNTLCDILNKLQRKGITNDFRWLNNGFTLDAEHVYAPDALLIVKVFRFEELKDPGDQCILYLIETNDGKAGYVLDTYGVYSNYDGDHENGLRQIKERTMQEQLTFTL